MCILNLEMKTNARFLFHNDDGNSSDYRRILPSYHQLVFQTFVLTKQENQ